MKIIITKSVSALCLITFWISTANAQTIAKDEPSSLEGKSTIVVKLPSTLITPNPMDALRKGKLIYVKSSSILVGNSVVEEKLQKRPEFQQLGLMITRDEQAADIILELHHDILTKYVYTAVDAKTYVVVAGEKLSSLGGTVAGKVAERFMKQIMRARYNPGP